MITFWVHPYGAFEASEYLQGRGAALADQITIRTFQLDRDQLDVPAGPQILSGLDQLTDAELRGVAELRERLVQQVPAVVILNDAVRSLGRRKLLETLALRGINQFRVYPANRPAPPLRYPVFVRGESAHDGSLTRLLHSESQLQRALRALRLRGRRLSDLLIVEFCDTSDPHGVFRKYSAIRIGDAIVPAHLLQGHHWMVKWGDSDKSRASFEEDLAFVERHPHERDLREIFTLAGIEYGRIDYSMLGDVPQVWEINLNPTLARRIGKAPVSLPPELADLRERARSLSHAKMREAFLALDTGEAPRLLTLHLTPQVRRAVARATRKRRRRKRAIELLRRSYESPIGAPLRALLSRAFPHH